MNGSNRLAVLAAEITRAHDASIAAQRSALEQAIIAGKALIEAKESLKHGEWLPWLQRNVPFGPRMAQHYMRLAELPEPYAKLISHLNVEPTLAQLIKWNRADARVLVILANSDTGEAEQIAYVWQDRTHPGYFNVWGGKLPAHHEFVPEACWWLRKPVRPEGVGLILKGVDFPDSGRDYQFQDIETIDEVIAYVDAL